MIRTDKEYRELIQRINEYEKFFKTRKAELIEKENLSEDNAEFALQPARLLYEQIKFEVDQYERIKRGDIDAIQNLESIGQMLIAVRIALGMTQKELAERLKVSEAQVSKDEKHEYAGISVQKAQNILNQLGVSIRTEVTLPSDPGLGRYEKHCEDFACV